MLSGQRVPAEAGGAAEADGGEHQARGDTQVRPLAASLYSAPYLILSREWQNNIKNLLVKVLLCQENGIIVLL